MGPRRRDPFEGVNLDDEFVRAARFVEPSAAERTGVGAAPGTSTRARVLARGRRPVSGRRTARRAAGRAVRGVGWVRRSHRNAARFLALLALLLGVAAAGVLLMIRQGAGRPGHTGRWASPAGGTGAGGSIRAVGTFAVMPGALALDPTLDAMLRPGVCLNWAKGAGGRTTARAVDCGRAHLDEVTSVLDLRAAGSSSWPGQDSLLGLAETRCVASLAGYLPAAPNPAPAHLPSSRSGPAAAPSPAAARGLVAAAVYPDESAWRGGAHHLACTGHAASGATLTGSLRATSSRPSTVPPGTSATARPASVRPASARPATARPASATGGPVGTPGAVGTASAVGPDPSEVSVPPRASVG